MLVELPASFLSDRRDRVFNRRSRLAFEVCFRESRQRMPRREDRMRVLRGVPQISHPTLQDPLIQFLRLGERTHIVIHFRQQALGGCHVLTHLVGSAEAVSQIGQAGVQELIHSAPQRGDLLFRRGIDRPRPDLGKLRQNARSIHGHLRRGEQSVQRVIVLRADRVVLVVVASRALRRHTEQAARHHINLIVDHVGQRAGEPAAHRQKSQRRLIGLPGVGNLIGRQLQRDEAVVRQVLVERPDDPVAIGVGEGPAPVFAGSDPARVSVADDVEPMPRPMHAVLR